jgi:hypothetical protein
MDYDMGGGLDGLQLSEIVTFSGGPDDGRVEVTDLCPGCGRIPAQFTIEQADGLWAVYWWSVEAQQYVYMDTVALEDRPPTGGPCNG